MIRRAMRLCLWAQAGLLGSLGLYALVSLAASSATDSWASVVTFSTALLLPAALYLLALSRYLRDETQGRGSPKPAGAVLRAFPLVLSVVLYLPLMILMSSDTQGWKWPLAPISLFPVLWLFCACAYGWVRGERPPGRAENIRPRRDLGHWLETTSRILRSPVVLLLGAALLACSVLIAKTYAFGLLNGRGEMWITAEYGLGERIPAARFLLDYLGRFVCGGSLLLAACTVVLLLVCKFSSAMLRTSRVAAVLGLVASFLAICSITDYYFSWLSFMLDGHLPVVNWMLFILFFLHWLVPLLFAAAVLRARRTREEAVDQELRIIVVFYTPLFLFDLAMTPFFTDDLETLFFPTAFLGLQFLAWGYLELAGTGFSEPLVR